MKTIHYISILLLLLTTNACGLYGNYSRPALEVSADSLYREYVQWEKSDTSSIADLNWRELFTDPQLVKWIETGLERNTDLRTAALRCDEAEAALGAAKMAYLPSVSLSAQGSISKLGSGSAVKTYSIGPSADWVIDAFGSLRGQKKSKWADYEGALAYTQAVQTQLIADIACTYYSLIALDQQLAITDSSAQASQRTVLTMEALKRAGEQTEAAVQQSHATLLEVQASHRTIQQQIQELENSFAALVGITPQPIARSQDLKLTLNQNIAVGVPAKMLSRRPDVRYAEWNLVSAFYATSTARAAFYPTITLSGTAGWTNNYGEAVSNPGKWLLNAVGSLTQPLFNRGTNIANLKIAKAKQQEAVLAFSQSLLDAGVEVNNALAEWQAASDLAAIHAKRIDALQQTTHTTQLLMKHGSVNYLEVLTAQQALLAAQLTEVQNSYSLAESVIRLYCALGGGTEQ
ncbi:MAG: efflux transporter outer membrane subunit [Muribaculaceae bacterium]